MAGTQRNEDPFCHSGGHLYPMRTPPWWLPSYQSPSMMLAQSRALPKPCSRLSVARMPAYT